MAAHQLDPAAAKESRLTATQKQALKNRLMAVF